MSYYGTRDSCFREEQIACLLGIASNRYIHAIFMLYSGQKARRRESQIVDIAAHNELPDA